MRVRSVSLAFVYLSTLLLDSIAELQSAGICDLIVPSTKTKSFGSRRFRSAASNVWNSLRIELNDRRIGRR